MAGSIQVFSHNRFSLGYGAGWAQDEFTAYGYEFPPTRVRIEQMVEGIKAIRALWTQAPTNFEGRWYHLRDAYCEPRPHPPPPPPADHDRRRRREIPPAGRRRARRLVERTHQVDRGPAPQAGCAASALRRWGARLRLHSKDLHVHGLSRQDQA